MATFVGKVKGFTQDRERELDGSSKKVRMTNRFGTFWYLGNGHVAIE